MLFKSKDSVEAVKSSHAYKKIFLFAFCIPLGALMGVLLWFSSAQRQVDWLKPYLLSAVEKKIAPYHLDAGNLVARVNITNETLDIDLGSVNLLDADGQKSLVLPQTKIGLGLLKLLVGKVAIESLQVDNPELKIAINADNSVVVKVADDKPSFNLPQIAAALASSGLREVILRDGKTLINFVDKSPAILFKLSVPELRIDLKKHKKQLDADVVFRYSIANVGGGAAAAETLVRSKIKLLSMGAVQGNAQISNLDISYLSQLDNRFSSVDGLNLLLNADADFMISNNGIDKLALNISGVQGKYENRMILPQPLSVDKFMLKTTSLQNFAENKIENLQLNSKVSPAQEIQINLLGDYNQGNFVGKANIAGVSMDKLGDFWPLTLSPITRNWVVSNITKGKITEARADINLRVEDLSAPFLPSSFISADLTLQDGVVRYLEGLPELNAVNGKVHFSGISMAADIQSGTVLQAARVSKLKVNINDFNELKTGVPLQVAFDVSAPAHEVAAIANNKRLGVGKDLQLDEKKITGEISGNLFFDFPIYPEDLGIKLEDTDKYLKYKITAQLKNLAQENILGKWRISALDGDLEANDKELNFSSDLVLNGLPANLDVNLQMGKAGKTTYDLAIDMPANRFADFALNKPEWLSGTAGIEAHVEESTLKDGSKLNKTKAKLDLQAAEVNFAVLGWKKPAGTAGKLDVLMSSGASAEDNIESFKFDIAGFVASGSARNRHTDGMMTYLQLDHLKQGDTDIALTYNIANNGMQDISLRGKYLDLSVANKDSANDNPLDKFNNLKLDINLEKIRFSEGRELKNLNASINCGKQYCTKSRISAQTINGKPFIFNLDSNAGGREVTMRSEDAGGVMKAFNVNDHLEGGKLDFNGKFVDSTLHGKLLIEDFRVMKSPVFTRLFTLASLTGVLDTLTGQGVWFKKLSTNIEFGNNLLVVKDGKAYGSEIGITTEGKIVPFGAAENMDIRGTLVPAYTANSILGNIPVLGNLLVGKGGGVFAANYSMKGKSADPSVMINPLSLLTPGFLRGLFDVFDEKAKVDK